MRACLLGIVCALGLFTHRVPGAAEPPLPDWNAPPQTLEMTGEESSAENPPQTETEPLDVPPPSADEISATNNTTEEIPGKFWPAYFDERPKTFLLDPQGLLGPIDFRERLAFLKNHASDSAIDLWVYLFKGTQELPGAVRAEELVERLFTTGRPAAIVYYYLGAPQRAVLYLSPSLTDVVPATEPRRALESSILQAAAKTDPARQIESFLVQMSIRIYWMERMLETHDAAENLPATTPSPATPPPVAPKREKLPTQKAVLLVKLNEVLNQVWWRVVPVALFGSALAMGVALTFWLRRRKRFQFPVWAVEPRLGGAHAAGVGAVISFANAAVSPASQRTQLADPPRRI